MEFNLLGQLQCRVRALENKIDIYKKQIIILEEKVKIYENDSLIKANKINEQLDQISSLEKENDKLEKSILEFSREINTNQNNLDVSQGYENEMFNLQNVIDDLKKQNKKLSKELLAKTNENELFNQDNTILLTKVKEYEEHQLNNEELSNNFSNQLKEYNSIVNDEIKIISNYIDTYLCMHNFELKVPTIYTMTNFSEDFINFDMLKNAIEKAKGRIVEDQTKNKEIVNKLKSEICNYQKKLQENLKDINELKSQNTELKENIYVIEVENGKMLANLDELRELNKKLQNSVSNNNNLNDNYFEKLFQVLKIELEAALIEEPLKKFASIAQADEGEEQNDSRFRFESMLEKFLTINKEIIKEVRVLYKGVYDKSVKQVGKIEEVNELNKKIGMLKKDVSNYEKEINLAKEERNLLISQIELMEKKNSSEERSEE